MLESAVLESAVLDHLDRQIVRALQIDPRAPFSRIAEVLGVSEQTVARRYRRLRGDGYLREDPVARAYLDARVQTIFGGTTEIMKEIIGRSLGV